MKHAKKKYIEILRIFAMFAVVLNHICITATTDFVSSSSDVNGIIYVSIRNLCRFAVPIFFMISGALLLNPNKELTIKKLLKNYLLKYGLVIIVFGWGFAALEEIFQEHTINTSTFIKSFINMLQGKSWNHMWYMYSLFGTMLFLPVLKVVAENFLEAQIKYILIVGFLFLSIIPMIELWTRVNLNIEFPMNCVYCYYMLLGYWLDTLHIRLKKNEGVLAILICSIILIVEAYLKVEYAKDIGVSSYSSPIILICACSIYNMLLNKIGDVNEYKQSYEKIIEFLSKHSFGVYIVHMLWINILYKLIKINPFEYNAILIIPILWFVVLVASLVTTMIMKKIPLIKKII